jgi:hypothetical protein
MRKSEFQTHAVYYWTIYRHTIIIVREAVGYGDEKNAFTTGQEHLIYTIITYIYIYIYIYSI